MRQNISEMFDHKMNRAPYILFMLEFIVLCSYFKFIANQTSLYDYVLHFVISPFSEVFRYILATSFEYVLAIFMKLGKGVLHYRRNMSGKVFSKKLKNY